MPAHAKVNSHIVVLDKHIDVVALHGAARVLRNSVTKPLNPEHSTDGNHVRIDSDRSPYACRRAAGGNAVGGRSRPFSRILRRHGVRGQHKIADGTRRMKRPPVLE